MLSDRYISDRFLPDKAIDLVDEAASRLRMEIDSSPLELDEAERRVRQLEIELAAMEKESKEVREPVERELAEAQVAARRAGRALVAARRRRSSASRRSRARSTSCAWRPSAPSARATSQRVAEIRYGELPELEKELAERDGSRDRAEPMVKEEVDEDDIAAVVAAGPGIPVDAAAGGRDREARPHGGAAAPARRSARTRRSRRSRTPCAARAPGSRTRTGRSARSSSSARPASGRPSSPARSPSSCSTTSARWCGSTCSEYQEQHTVARLIGAPPGYVGYEEGGQLTEAVRRRPYSVVLLDEIEKAHTEVFDVLLQILDDGRLTDGQGRTVDFRNTVIIMTSNVRSRTTQLRGHVPARVPQPGRRDRRVPGARRRSSSPRSSTSSSRGCASGSPSAGSRLELTDAAKEFLTEAGWDPAYGARPLKRAIQRYVENPLALAMLEGGFGDGDTIRVTAEGDEITFEKAKAAEPAAASA